MRKKYDKYFEQENKEMVKLGMENQKYINNAFEWCKHFRVEMKSSGFLAQMTGLPIGSHEVSCQYARGGFESMNLPRVIPEFIINNCDGCKNHSSNGKSLSWGMRIIEENKQKNSQHELEVKELNEHLEKLRTRIKDIPQKAKEYAKIDERQTLTFIEELFSEDKASQLRHTNILIESVRIGADLFPMDAIDLLIEQSISEEFGECCLPICAELASYRHDLADRLRDTSFKVIENAKHIELATKVLRNLGNKVFYPLETKYIMILIKSNSYYRFFFAHKEPSFPNTIEILAKCYDVNSDSIINPLRLLLRAEDNVAKINACGTIEELQTIRPQIGIDLLDDLIVALNCMGSPYEDSVDSRARLIIENVFRYDPIYVDKCLTAELPTKEPMIQQDITGIYCGVLRQREDTRDKPMLYMELALKRCIDFVKMDKLDLEIRLEIAQAMDYVSSYNIQLILPFFDQILGYYALICEYEEPPKPLPQIILPGRKNDSKMLEGLENFSHKQTWNLFKHKLLECIKGIVENASNSVGDTIIKFFDNVDIKANKELKRAIVVLLGKVGKSYSFQPAVLPLLMKALMDFETQLVRAAAVSAIEEMYSHSESNPPRDVVDVLILHLRDEYVIVHKAAIHVFQWTGARWLDKNQVADVLYWLSILLNYYKKEPYYLDDICQAFLNIAYRFSEFKDSIIRYIFRVFPTNEELVDGKILEIVMRHVEPTDQIAELVAPKLSWYIVTYERDRYNSYSRSERNDMFNWLYEIPEAIYIRLKPVFTESALQLAQKDAWEAMHFACLFSRHCDFTIEKDIIEVAANGLKGEKSYEEFYSILMGIHKYSISNIQLGNV